MVGGVGERRLALVEAAYHRIADGGLEGLRLRQVAMDVGIDHSTLHHHLATKRDLIAAVVTYTIVRFRSTMPEDGAPATRLRGHLSRLRHLLDGQPELFVVTAELDLHARRDPTVRAALTEMEAGWRVALADIVSEGQRSGGWSDSATPAEVAELVIATVKGVRLTPTLAGPVFDQLGALITRSASL